jgi:TolB-like protein/tetratricopeptide (TPR) repeat protein
MDQGKISFGRFQLDLQQRELTRDGVPVELSSRALEILCVLASANGELVSKDELMKRVWPGLVVEENNIQVHVSALRKALDEGKSGKSYLMTVPSRGYCLVGAQPAAAATGDVDSRPSLAVPDRPSIAVLPFQNMSGDADQEYFADGVVDEIITALSRFSSLFVIARNSSFTYKGRAVDVKQAGRELGVRYVLEGSVRKAAHRVRITGQLVDAANGAHLWADRFEGALDDIFDLQDQMTASIVGAIAPKLEQAEIERAKRKPTKSLDAYDYFLRGMEYSYQHTSESVSEALRLFSRATELDSHFAASYGMAAYCYVRRQANGWMANLGREIAETARLARKAVQVGKDDAVALSRAGHALAYVVHELDAGALFIDRALVLNPNLASAWFSSGWLRVWIGEPDVAIKHFAQFRRMSPLDHLMPVAQSGSAFAHFLGGRYDEALSQAERVLQESPNFHTALRISAASNALAGRIDAAQRTLARLRQVDPALRVSNLKDLTPLRRPEDIARYEEGMRRAGLPE